MARVRERQSQRPGGANFVGPMPMPVVERPAMPANSGGVGRLVPSSSGGVKWQAGAGPGATPPPQSQPAMPVIPAAMAAPRPMQAPGSRIAQSPANRPYAEMPGGGGSLANRPVRRIGRSMAEAPERRLETAARQGDMRAVNALVGLKQAGMSQDFARERDAVNFAQQQQMFDQQRQAMDARDARQFDQSQYQFEQQQAAMNARDERNFQQQQQAEAARRAAALEEQQRREQAGRITGFENVPTPDGRGYVPVARRADGSMDPAGGYMPTAPAAGANYQPVPGTNILMPVGEGANRLPLMQQQGVTEAPRPAPDFNGPMPATPRLVPYAPEQTTTQAPTTRTIDLPDGSRQTVQWNAQTGQWEPVTVAGQQSAPPPAAAAAGGPVTLPKGTTTKGATWNLFQP